MWELKQYFLYTTLCALPILISSAISNYYKQRLKELEDPNEGDVCLFTITPKNHDCWRHVINRTTCGEECSLEHLQKLVKRIKSAKFEVLMCANHLTVNDMANAMVMVKERGVDVRCLTDYEMIKVGGSKYRFLKENGISIKINKSGKFHHKFFMVDQRVVCFGSMNFTMQGLTKNFESIIESENQRIISRFKDEFEFLWINKTMTDL